jgi:hypothetical protein
MVISPLCQKNNNIVFLTEMTIQRSDNCEIVVDNNFLMGFDENILIHHPTNEESGASYF